jgi:NADH dehydrogenase [ubiquinone] 1 alpha subcomplex assembly factor 2
MDQMENAEASVEKDILSRYVVLPTCLLSVCGPSNLCTGTDLSGNTFWEFKDAIRENRWRRIVKAGRNTEHSDVQISPQWHQWLRQTRPEPPSLQEQLQDVQRQEQMKELAKSADERWAAKARYIEKPKPTVTPQLSGDPQFDRARAEQDPTQPPRQEKTKSAVDTPKPAKGEDPWKKADEVGANPGATWKPEAWVPGSAKR